MNDKQKNSSDELDHLFKKLLLGIEITPQEKKVLINIYGISLYKLMVEVLFGITGEENRFKEKLDLFLKEIISSLATDQLEAFNKTLDKHKANLLFNIFTTFAANLPAKEGDIIKANMDNVFGIEK